MGASVARHFVWDAVRAFDYLASRPDVDEARIGVTGNSGGGTQTMYLMLAEPRLAAAVPCTFPTTLEALQMSGQAQDMEQIVYSAIRRGPDHDDFFTALAPKPVLAGAVAYDFFPIEGSHELLRRARRVYELYGCAENAVIAVDNSLHCYSDGLRQACVNWFRRHLQNRPGDFVTGAMEALPAAELQATRSGQILRDFPDARTITDLTVEYLELLPTPESGPPPETKRRQLAQTLGVDRAGERAAPIFPRIVEEEVGGWRAEKIWFFSAPDVVVAGVLYHPPQAAVTPLPATILLLEDGTAADYRPRAQKLLAEGERVFVFDVRGVGGVASRSVCTLDAPESDLPFHSEYKMACDALLAGLSTLGLRVFDILRGFDYLQTRADVSEVRLHGVGAAATWAYFAGALEPRIAALTCEEMLASYRALCRERFYDHTRFDLRIMAWGLLRGGDIADFLPLIAPRPISFIAPLDPLGHVTAAPILE
jgi:cephalosporin-C deacetylase-like acetyl esterase